MTHVPEDAELYTLHHYTFSVDGGPSKWFPGRRKQEVERMRCMGCHHVVDMPENGVPGHCPECDLQWIVHGNCLRVWRKE